MDIAYRVYSHSWKIDPIIRSVLDTDFYKLLMTQSIRRHRPDARITFGLINRTQSVPVAELIDEAALRAQLDHVRGLRLSRGESTWLRGNSFFGKRAMFSQDYIDWLEGFRFPDYRLERRGDQYELSFEGAWPEATMWEIPALAVLMELRSRSVLKGMGKFELQVLYARAMARVWEKIERLRKLPGQWRVADFGTRRRHGYLWQDWCVQAMTEGLGPRFSGTSNCLIAKDREVEATGTNAHELPMVYASLAEDDAALALAPYQVMQEWQEDYGGNLLILLPDTYTSRVFFDRAPAWVSTWRGARIDSGDPFAIGDAIVDWWRSRGVDPREKLLIFSDGLDVDLIERLHAHFIGRVELAFGWGTLLTNDFRGLAPDDRLAPFSLVCKVVDVEGRPVVKLSDNPVKSTGPDDEIARYRAVFDAAEGAARPVLV